MGDLHKIGMQLIEKGSKDPKFAKSFKKEPVVHLREAGIPVEAGTEQHVERFYSENPELFSWNPFDKCNGCKIGCGAAAVAIVAALTAVLPEAGGVEAAAEAGAEEEGISVGEWISEHLSKAVDLLEKIPGISRSTAITILKGLSSLSVGTVLGAICHATGACK